MNTDTSKKYIAPDTRYFKTQEEFNAAVGKDFIDAANQTTQKGQIFFAGLSPGKSPSGAYQYILDHYSEIQHPDKIYYTFVNSPLKSQEGLQGITDAVYFIRKLLEDGRVLRMQVFGRNTEDEAMENYAFEFSKTIALFLLDNNKSGLDYVFLASNPGGRVAGIERNSKAFGSKELYEVVTLEKEKEITATPYFLKRTARIAFLATKADKRRTLAWLYAPEGEPDESPSFIRYIENVSTRLTVFIDDKALTWPDIEIVRETPYGPSTIRLDLANPYKANVKEKLPVIILIHGFLGLNTFDALLTTIPTTKYIAAAMHYGTIPNDLPITEYSKHVVRNIDAVVEYFGSKGHPVYIFDHSMSNIYFLMMERNIDQFSGIKKYLKGRIGANPFFGEEAKHALLGFLDNVIIPSMTFSGNILEKSMAIALRSVVPLDSKRGVRRRGILLSLSLIEQDSSDRTKVWDAIKERIVFLMTNMDSLPHLNRIPVERALYKVPPKIFAIQIYSALIESKVFDKQVGLFNRDRFNIPVLILKSERDGVAKFVPRLYKGPNIEVMDITNPHEKDLFREHLYHMVDPQRTARIIDDFINKCNKGQ